MRVYEIHITVDLSDIFNFNLFCKLNNIKTILAIDDSSIPIQCMTGMFVLEDDLDLVMIRAKYLERELEKFNVRVIKIKIEQRISDLSQIEKIRHNSYFEYHIKIGGPQKISTEIPLTYFRQFNELKAVVKKNNCSISCVYKYDELKFILTFRIDASLDTELIEKIKNELVDNFKKRLSFDDNDVVKEYLAYDSLIDYDLESIKIIKEFRSFVE